MKSITINNYKFWSLTHVPGTHTSSYITTYITVLHNSSCKSVSVLEPDLLITIIIIIALKGAIQDFFFLFLQSPKCPATCPQHVRSSDQDAILFKSLATHRALITYNMSCATWYKGTAQLLSVTEFKSHLFLALFYWLKPLTDEGGNRSTRRKPLMTSLRKCHKFKPQPRLEPAL